MDNLCNSPISNMGLEIKGDLWIKHTNSSTYIINEDTNLYVEDSNIIIIDFSKSSNINITVDQYSNVEYFIINSLDSKRVFNNLGNLNITQICLNETNEELLIDLNKEHSSCNVNYLAISNSNNCKYIQRINHNSLNTKSNIKNVAVSMNKSNIVFDTTGFVKSGMSGCLCQQLSKGVVMDDESSITAKPILLIDEFDCFANHGASIGKISDEDLFYLMSRGLSKTEAFLLILKGIIKPYIDALPNDILKENADNEITNLIWK